MQKGGHCNIRWEELDAAEWGAFISVGVKGAHGGAGPRPCSRKGVYQGWTR